MSQNIKGNRKVNLYNAIGTLQVMIGGFCSFAFGFGFIGCIGNRIMYKTVGIGATLIIFILFILSAYMLSSGLKRKRLTRVYYACAQQLMMTPTLSAEQLAKVLRMPLKSLKRDLDTIVKKGFIPENIEDKNYHEDSQNSRTEEPALEPKLEEYVELNCRNCGAPNRILKGSAVNCEYCGSLMKSR